jgi:antitoxin component of MazEF toxin-antitoxin module
MSSYDATVIKTGNSYALRVPKAYVEHAKLKLGQKVQISSPLVKHTDYNPEAFRKAVKKLQEVNAFSSIKDPVTWQREIRKDRPLPDRNS